MNMSRAWIVLAALAIASSGADAAQVYKCRTAHGLSYQDEPCRGRDYAKNLVETGEPSVVRNTRTDNLAEWTDRVDQENRKRELETRAARLERENRADQAEFAAMVEEIDRQKDAASQGAPDLPNVDTLQYRQRQAQQEFANRVQRRKAELQDVQAELGQYEQNQ